MHFLVKEKQPPHFYCTLRFSCIKNCTKTLKKEPTSILLFAYLSSKAALLRTKADRRWIKIHFSLIRVTVELKMSSAFYGAQAKHAYNLAKRLFI